MINEANEELWSDEFNQYVKGTFINWSAVDNISATIDEAVGIAEKKARFTDGRVYLLILSDEFEEAFLEALDWPERAMKPASDECHGLFVTSDLNEENTIMLEWGQFWDIEEDEDEED